MLPIIQPRQCGECTVCCTVCNVDDLHKPAHVPCEHECATGCAIYQRRPGHCRQFQCSWLAGDLQPEELRPDKCGIMFEHTSLKNLDGAGFPDDTLTVHFGFASDEQKLLAHVPLLMEQLRPGMLMYWVNQEMEESSLSYRDEIYVWEQFLKHMKDRGEVTIVTPEGVTVLTDPARAHA